MPPVPYRPRDAAASRRALLDAAAELFQERGYDRATVREIGERAGVDPALIARYFSGKEGLYLAALAEEWREPRRSTIGTADLVEFARMLLAHWDESGMSPAMRALIGPPPSDEAREQVRSILGAAIIEPLATRLADRGLSQPRRRVELLLAAMVGVELLRRNGVLPAMDHAPTAELLELLDLVADGLQHETVGPK
jgi:AcrR family transcriptional regulator